MVLRIYSVLDEKSEEYSPPFFAANDRLAERMIMEASKGQGSMLAAYPEDFKLYRIGEFDALTGEIKPEQRPILLLNVKDLTRGFKNNAEN